MIREFRTISRHALIYGSGFLLARAVGFLLVPLYTRFLAPEAYGVIELLDLTGYLLGTFFAFGMDQAVMRFYHENNDPARQHRVISTALLFAAASGFVLVLLLVPARALFAELILGSRQYTDLFYLAFVTLLITSVLQLQKTTLRTQNRSMLFTIVSLVQTGIALVLNIYFVAILKLGPIGIYYSTLIGASTLSLFLGWRLFRETGFSFDGPLLKSMFRYGIYFVPAGLASFVLNWTDRYFLRAYGTMEVIGLYALGYKIALIVVLIVAVPFNQTWHSYMFEIQRQDNAKEVYARVATYFIAALTAVALCIATLSKEIVVIMAAPAYFQAHTVIPITCMAMIWFSSDNVFQVGLLLNGQSNRLSSARWAAAGLNFVLNWWLIPPYGMMGAAVATLLSFAFAALFILYRAQQTYYVPFEYRRMIHLSLVALAVYGGATVIPAMGLWVDVAAKCAILAIFPIALFATGFFTTGEKATLRDGVAQLQRLAVARAGAQSATP